MIDLNRLREHTNETIALLLKKDPSFDAQRLYELDKDVRRINLEVEQLRQQKNELADAAKGGITQELRQQSIDLGKFLKEKEHEQARIEKDFMDLYLICPNLLSDDVPSGNKESNRVVRTWAEKPTFSFQPKNHVELGNALGWFDFDSASAMTGSQFALYKGESVKLMYALTMFMLKNNEKRGFQLVLPPYMVNERSLEISSNFPKFKNDMYHIQDEDLYLIPTSEVSLTNLHRKQVYDADALPLRQTSWTSCFRREAGGYGAHERGLIRIHQFEKVELYSVCTPDQSEGELDEMVTCAEAILQALGLHYRVSLLAAQDCSFQSAKTYDIEVWMPGQNAYYEVSSCSNCKDFQARRGLIRYRNQSGDKPQYAHTLNGSSLALPRLMVALMETYQQPDGTIQLPDILKGYGLL
jgi:seryl-tRNA synthetase